MVKPQKTVEIVCVVARFSPCSQIELSRPLLSSPRIYLYAELSYSTCFEEFFLLYLPWEEELAWNLYFDTVSFLQQDSRHSFVATLWIW